MQAPVRLFVVALLDSGLTGAENQIIAVELALPMVCVGKRIKRDKKEKNGGTEIKIDYIENATKKLGYEWMDNAGDLTVAHLYEQTGSTKRDAE
jgi:hypothetical protein